MTVEKALSKRNRMEGVRALYIGFNRSLYTQYLEPTLRVIGQVTRLERYGPGFSTTAELEMGVRRWLDDRGPYSVIVTDDSVLNFEKLLKRKISPFQGGVHRFPLHHYPDYVAAYCDYFWRCKTPRLIIANWDTWAVSRELIEQIIKYDAWVLSYEDASLTEPLEHIARRPSMVPFAPFDGANDNWYEFVTNYKSKVLSFPHFINSVDFVHIPLEHRPVLFSVPGTTYAERKKAKECLDLRGRLFDLQCKATRHLVWGMHKRKRQSMLDMHEKTFMNALSCSKACFVSGSSMRIAVRKYFEVPARGTLMLCEPCRGFANLGFRGGDNCEIAEGVEKIKAVLSEIDGIEYQSIAGRGQMLVWEKHSEAARVRQFGECLHRILKGEFHGSYWDSGTYKFWEKES